jgi:FAD/FMN-containing dehydrogenase
VVGADGVLRHANSEQNQDLYWAVRGGGSNFGVVTGFEFQLHPMDRYVLLGSFLYPYSQLEDALDFYAEFSANAPDELNVDLVYGFPPGSDQGFVSFQCVYCGEEAQGRKLLGAFASLGKPLRETVEMTDYEVIQRSNDSDAPRATATYLKGGFLSEMNPGLIGDIVDGMEPAPGRSTMMIFQQAGGAIGRVPADATAFPHRYANSNMMVTVGWKPGTPRDPHVAYIKQFWKTLAPYTHGFYTVEADDDNKSQWNQNYQGNYPRLAEIKRRYDPENLFRLNANVLPA